MMKKWIELMACLVLAALAIVPQSIAANTPAITVGRVYAIEGDLLRYVPEEKDWVAMVKDAPFGTEDTLFSGNRGMSEMLVPNGTWIRVGNSTQIQVIALDADLSELDVAEGVVRFYNKGSDTLIKATSPFGYVLAYPETVFDLYVGENSVEVIAVKGTVSFVHTATDARYDVAAGSPSILADENQVSSGDGTTDPDWNRWNQSRDRFWAAKARAQGRSVKYLPPDLRDESYALEENGRWESIPYEGSSRWFWRPTTVAVGWSPFTAGRWTDWNGDQVWIPAEPFGYVTHHYGNWIYTRNSWYWAPPVVRVRVGLPLLDIAFFWSPGRVSWIHHDTHVGWVPLAPREIYYSHRRWGGPHEVVVTNINMPRITINIGSYINARRAIVVPRDHFYRETNYKTVRVTNINTTTIINNYKPAPVINNTVINNYTTNKQRHTFTNAEVKEKPHNTVINRIEKNAPAIERGRKENAVVVREQVKNIKEGKVNREARIETPKSTSHIVPAKEVNQPKSEMNLPQREIKTGGKPKPPAAPPQVIPAKPQQADEPVSRPERAAPVKPGQPEKPGEPARPPRVIPAKPEQPEKPDAKPERAAPVKPGQEDKSRQPARPQRVIPAKPEQSERPDVLPERVTPVKPNQEQQSRQPARPQRVIPAKPEQPEKPDAKPERAAPVKPGQEDKSRQPAQPQRVIPAKPEQPEKPDARPERAAPVNQNQQERQRDVKPAGKVFEKSREVKPPEQTVEKQKAKPPEKNLEEAREPRPQEPVQKQIEKSKQPKRSEKDLEKRRKGDPTDKEE
jgi:hypothetical protein